MSGFAENTTFGASDKKHTRNVVMNLTTARKMLPLVSRIVTDILTHQSRLDVLYPRQNRLDRQKRDLVWQERQHRYAIHEEITQLDKNLQENAAELDLLGVALLDPVTGRVGFPTLVNNRPAYFAWSVGETAIQGWHFAGEDHCRTIPKSWYESEGIPVEKNS
jgi:hypothetical protein